MASIKIMLLFGVVFFGYGNAHHGKAAGPDHTLLNGATNEQVGEAILTLSDGVYGKIISNLDPEDVEQIFYIVPDEVFENQLNTLITPAELRELFQKLTGNTDPNADAAKIIAAFSPAEKAKLFTSFDPAIQTKFGKSIDTEIAGHAVKTLDTHDQDTIVKALPPSGIAILKGGS